METVATTTIIKDSRFEIRRLLGEGGCAKVFEAFDRRTGRIVALKVLANRYEADAVAIARFEREARAAVAINHPNVCRLLAYGRLDDGQPYVAMEPLRGETLRDCLRRRGALTAEEAIEVGVQILSGLEAVHGLGLVHRDLKPENVFVVWSHRTTEPATIKLLDFGLCRRASDPLDGRTLTALGSVVGTPGYLAPENATGERQIDPRADLFAVGLVLFETLAGRPAYRGRNAVELLSDLLSSRLPSLRTLRGADVPMTLDRIVAHATEHDRRARYQTAASFQHDLLEARTAMRRALRASRPEPTELARSAENPTAAAAAASSGEWDEPTRRMPISLVA